MAANFRNIPTEILEEVLFESLPSLFDTPDGLPRIHDSVQEDMKGSQSRLAKDFAPSFAIHNMRVSLMLTCKRWRNIILESRKFWTRVEVDAYAFSKEPERFQALLNRSGILPLDVKFMLVNVKAGKSKYSFTRGRLMFGQLGFLAPPSFNRRIGDILRSQFYRIRLLAINYDSGAEHKELTSQLFPASQCTELPILEHLYGHARPSPFGHAIQPTIGSIRAPRLKSFMITAVVDGLWSSLEPDTVAALTSLSLDLFPPDSNNGIELSLTKCQNLRELTWSRVSVPLVSPAWHRNFFDTSCSEKFKFLNLESLSIKLSKPEEFTAITERFETPQLHSFTFIGDMGPLLWIGPFLLKNPQLQELMIKAATFQPYNDILKPLTELKILVLYNCKPSKEFLLSFLPCGHESDRVNTFLPSLDKFVIESPAFDFVISRTLLELIEKWITDREKRTQFDIWFEEEKLGQLPTKRAFLDLVEKYPDVRWKIPQPEGQNMGAFSSTMPMHSFSWDRMRKEAEE
ncbi:hypothetical protein M422DRAFT_23244 [Sphaerobolus stellatus SS14]|nr:hypothetical protein M422DRAFT_23244 [Sphaerobolus stellatus SS14]